MAEYELAVLVLDVLVEPDAGADFDQDRASVALWTSKRLAAQRGSSPRCPCPPEAAGVEGYRRLMGPRGEAAN